MLLQKCRLDQTKVLATVLLILFIIILTYNICTCDFRIHADNESEVFILMYHNIIGDRERANKYEIRESKLEEDLKTIRRLGLEVVTPAQIIAYQQGKAVLPRRSVMLTFDDGYYSYITRLLPLLKKYNMRAVVNVVGEYTKYNKNKKDLSPRYTYLDYDDMAILANSGYVEIGLHSYNYHHIGKNNGASRRKGESVDDYRSRLTADTNKLKSALLDKGIVSNVYAYPYGAYSRSSDSILRDCGIKMTLSCSEGVNRVTKSSNLYLMRRYNRSGLGGRLQDEFAFFREGK